MAGLGARATALLVAVACVAITARVNAATLTVPSNTMPVATGSYAKWNTLYPNPQITSAQCKFVDIGPANAVGTHNIAIPGTSKHIFFEYPYNPEPIKRDWSIGVMVDISNPATWSTLKTPESLFCAGHTITSDGVIVISGGYNQKIVGPSYAKLTYLYGLTGVRIFDPATSSTKYVATSTDPRWYPSLLTLPDKRVAIIGGLKAIGNRGGGSNKIEFWDPKAPVNATMKYAMMDPTYFNGLLQKPSYPFAWVLPTGHVFLYGDVISCIWNPATGKCLTKPDPKNPANQILVSPPTRPGGVRSTYPWTGGAVMTSLKPDATNKVYQAEFILFGGSRPDDHPKFKASNYTYWFDDAWNTQALGSRYSHRITVSWSRASSTAPWTFSFGNWVQEDMGSPRIMPDTVLLPNDDVVMINGAQAGVAGWPIKQPDGSFIPMSNLPHFWASLYQPDKAVNSRFTLLCGSQTPRMYHSSATLNLDGSVLVAGGDRPGSVMNSGVSWFKTPTPTDPKLQLPPAYNMENFQPPYMFDTANKPMIKSLNGNADLSGGIGYNTQFLLSYGAAPGASNVAVTSVVLVAPSATTHSHNANQRAIRLLFKQTATAGSLQVTTPFDPFHAPSGWYMLFINNGKTYSTAKWVKLVDSANLGKVVPIP